MPGEAIEKLISQGAVWRGRPPASPGQHYESTGWRVLDDCIGGWPRGAVCELLSPGRQGLSLLLPLLARLSQGERWLAWVGPPYLPYAPALVAAGVDLQRILLVQERDTQQCLWASEQLLRSSSCALVLAWPQQLQAAQLRRLQLAAEQGGGTGVLFRSLRATAQASHAALRLRVMPSLIGLDVAVLKRPGGWGGQHCSVPL